MSKPGPRRGKYWARRWHRWLGVVFMLPLLWLTVSGLALRYAEELGLSEAMVKSGWVLEKYGMFPEGEVRQVSAGRVTVSEWGEVLFLDGKMLDEAGVLTGAVPFGNGMVVGTEEYLMVYDAAGEWEQKLGEESLPGVPVEALGAGAEGLVVVKAEGKIWRFDEDLLGLTEVDGAGVRWGEVTAGGDDAEKSLKRSIAEQAGIPWSRVMLDLHSGNLGGTTGKLLVDVTGIGIIVLTLMGFKLVFRKPRGGAGS